VDLHANSKAVPIRGAEARQDQNMDYDDYEYDSSELMLSEEDELVNETLAKSEDNAEIEEDDVEDEALPSYIPASAPKSEAEKMPPSKIQPPRPLPPAPAWRLYPHLLAQPTPPGKRVIVLDPNAQHSMQQPKAVDNHAVSYGLTAASVYARLQPSLRQKNGTIRPKIIPRPYRRRPTSATTTTTTPIPITAEEKMEDFEDIEEEEEEEEEVVVPTSDSVVPEEDPVKKEIESRHEVDEEQPESSLLDEEDDEHNNHEDDEEELLDELEDIEDKPLDKLQTDESEMENETVKYNSESVVVTSSSPPPSVDPMDIKELLRSAGPLSLSELLQQKGMSLEQLLKSGSKAAPVMASISTTQATTTTTRAAATTSTSLPTTTTTTRPDSLPSVKPISFRELLAAKNVSLKDIIGPTVTETISEKPSLGPVTLKPGVKLPVPFNPSKAKGLAGLVAPPAPTEAPEVVTTQPEESSSSIPVVKSINIVELKPLTFGSGGKVVTIPETTTTSTATEASTTTRTTAPRSKIPYVPAAGVGEYGTHMTSDDDEDENSNGTKSLFSNMVNTYGNQRPIATSRLTPAPPRKSRPVLNFNYNAISEEDEEEGGEVTTGTAILTHFNEEELFEDHPYFDLPLSVRSAIVVSSAIGGFCLLVFLVILVVFKLKQKSRIRLRHPAAILGLAHAANGLSGVGSGCSATGSDSSGITTPVSHPVTKSGYAKLPQRSSSLWGTLRRSVKQMDSVHYT